MAPLDSLYALIAADLLIATPHLYKQLEGKWDVNEVLGILSRHYGVPEPTSISDTEPLRQLCMVIRKAAIDDMRVSLDLEPR